MPGFFLKKIHTKCGKTLDKPHGVWYIIIKEREIEQRPGCWGVEFSNSDLDPAEQIRGTANGSQKKSQH